ncbi:MAG: IMP dehydrogenase, partial [Deltaproteobacteria bacterium]|nr:IMP dehydrogenase [Deltaproteobacteria bacterium]
MKAVIFHAPGNVTTENVDKPSITSADILIKVRSSCICGSD